MNRTCCALAVSAISTIVAASLFACASSKSAVQPLPEAVARPDNDRPRQIENLSDLSPVNPLNPFNKAAPAAPPPSPQGGASAQNSSGADSNPTIEYSGAIRHVGDDKYPGEVRLMNRKAAQYEGVSARVTDQIFEEMLRLERSSQFSRLKIHSELKPVIVTGTLNKDGKLRELVLEQHSGQAIIDKMVIDACKKGLYLNNPPVAMVTADGDYKIQIEAHFENFAQQEEMWTFKTYMAIGIL
ncbi:MAG TPA: hypothetical protein VEF03_12815 [Candidatus Binataceae bacterium]|nr:hypothetical protein [Candidatus Binataceae bacterium]